MVRMDPFPWRPLFGPHMYFGLFKCFDLRTFTGSYVFLNIFTILSHQACNLNLLCVAASPPWISSCTLLIMSFLKIWGGTITSALNIMPLSTVNLCRTSLKILSAIVQLLHTFFLMRSSIPLRIGFHWVSLVSILRDSTSVYTHCIILSSEFSYSSPFSL